MAINPATAQGVLNRLRASLIVDSNSALNVTSDFLSTEGIHLAPTGDTTKMIDTMTGMVGSQEAKQQVKITVNLNRAQGLANEWLKQVKKNSYLGQVRIISDSPVQDDRTVLNCFITQQPQEDLNGTMAKWSVELTGYEIINSDLWSLS
ncbi:hypothetical protein [Saccharibacter floricola]|uniref:Uncharacterized protein n=1 Tax=Saccharibacter floricola DSM 15669 TaxID=1123227 RepID=A0ABQ0P1D5_9PROT|nr:hypothetical protein [Saccharibacter floricola]GBQ08814.1 hypothetical protein AA15669_1919 [Saccharibacter floricola DSM 15669]